MRHLPPHSEPDLLLWNQVVKDDEKAFEKLFALFYPALAAYAQKYIEAPSICEDIAQDVFVSLWENRKNLIITSSLRNYLLISTRNNCLNYLRKENLNRQYQESLLKDSPGAENEDDLHTLTELYDMLEKAVARLPEGYRSVFEMHFLEGKKYDEIAETMNLSLRTVKRYNAQAVEILKNEFKDYLPIFLAYILLNGFINI